MKVSQSMPLIQHPFAKMAMEHPEYEAIIDGNRVITYSDLNKKANGIAHQLTEWGLQKGERVALVLAPSIEWVAAMLGVLKAGGVYVPLDPAYPRQRIHFCLQDSGAAYVISDGEISYFSQRSLHVHETEARDQFDSVHVITPLDPAYMIYTSGSTGQPKGVLIPHQAVSNHMRWMESQFGWEPRDVFLQKTSASFDASVWEFFAPLWCGARMVIHSGDALEICQTIRRHRVTVVQLVPSVLKLLVNLGEFRDCTTLRYVFVGGEPLPIPLVNQFHHELAIPLVNLYGPTEATIDTTFRICEPNQEREGDVVPIGRPIQNVSVVAVDENLQPCSPGEEGELLITGMGLAIGYHNRESLQAEKFVHLPWDPGQIGYRSGDLVRQLPSGEWMFLGRIDQQIKLRGLRIELGEIEAILLKQPAVKDTAVCLMEGEWLVAFVVVDPSWSEVESKRSLEDSLPGYMVPQFMVTLEAMPLLPNGKLDRKQLQTLPFREENSLPKVALTEWEEKVLCCWKAIFPIESVGISDSFFAVGGDSLKALRLIREFSQIGMNVPVSFVYDHPTICAQARELEAGSHLSELSETQKLKGNTGDYMGVESPLSFGQLGIHFGSEWSGGDTYQIQLCLQFHKEWAPDRIRSVLQEMTQRHVALHSVIEEREPGEFWQRQDPETPMVFNVWESEEQFSDESLVDHENNVKPQFDIIQGDPNQLIIRMHHLMMDGWSIRLFLQELDERLQGGEFSSLEDRSFYQFAQEQACGGQENVGILEDYLADAPGTSRFPEQWMEGVQQTSQGAQVKKRIDGKLYEAWQQVCKQLEVTPFSFLLTATQVCLAQCSGQQDVIVGVPVANRDDERFQRTIGNLVNLLPYRLKVKDPSTFSQLVQQTFQNMASLREAESVPFEKILTSLQVERDMNYHPLFQTMVVYNDYPISGKTQHFEWSEGYLGTTKCDASFQFYAEESHVDLVLEYCTDLFTKEVAETILDRWEQGFALSIDHPERVVTLAEMEAGSEIEENKSERPLKKTAVVKAESEDHVLKRVRGYWSQVLKVDDLKNEDRFFDRGGHSLSAMKLVAMINKDMGCNLSVKSIFEFPTLGEFAHAVGRSSLPLSSSARQPEAVVMLQKHDEGTPIFFVHPAGGAVWCYREMAEVFQENHPVYGIQSVRAEATGEYAVDLPELARLYVGYIQEIQPVGPYVIGGYSFGGNVAFEMACQLQKAGEEVALLAMIDCHISYPAPFRKSEFLVSFAEKCAEGQKSVLSEDELTQMSESDRLTYLLELGKESGHLPDDATVERLMEDVAMWQANNQAIRSYVMESRFHGKTLFLRAQENTRDSTQGWEERLVGDFSITEVPGHHFSIYKGENAREVGRLVKEELEKRG
ncbi:iturin family lipopeptide synthetase B/fengycin family lipopeptide synthetase D/tyrocidine synthetase-3 [Marininema mesophilum]|uniref:Iturin family lipopeptide synthetase B/fengycin family lipopeptide synthetase D/tyrocidine synthetase-3 n=1 Tax=Marininema mesophilum TaxID=1048340 RepID=A0A1H2T2H6_9BACL|nr:non-ribosomal peptide synthetase [Marininema mesophilum]SDW38007.1 iturin family lipopeptide synthetase B/fengycin family lipopeptide synthetase D/tyrocidine synthetase-3 [Marininema mesophilum]